MKKLEFIIAAFVLLPVTTFSQSGLSGRVQDSSNILGNHIAGSWKVMRIGKMDQRKIYNWGNGQRSTPTGRQAGEWNVSYAKVSGDSAVVVTNADARRMLRQERKPANNKNFLDAPVIPISQMDQRKIYNWGDGQRSTPTGRQAKEPNAKYARVLGDSAVVVKDPAIINAR